MEREKASKDITELFIRMVNKYNALEKIPTRHGSKYDLYHSERHILDMIGDRPGMNITELAGIAGVTKGAISQLVKKLESKGLIQRFKKTTNDKEIFLELSKVGKNVHEERMERHKEALMPLLEELKRHPDDKVAFLISMFKWFNDFLDESGKKMKMRHISGN